jgi:sugar-specific transcriptional regulator TrmB
MVGAAMGRPSNLHGRWKSDKRSGMKDNPKDMLADAKQIRKAVKSLRAKSAIDNLIRRGIALDRIERTIKDVEVAADAMTNKAKSRIAHRKRAKLKIVKS